MFKSNRKNSFSKVDVQQNFRSNESGKSRGSTPKRCPSFKKERETNRKTSGKNQNLGYHRQGTLGGLQLVKMQTELTDDGFFDHLSNKNEVKAA